MMIIVLLVALLFYLQQLCSFDVSWLTLLPVGIYIIFKYIPRGQILFSIGYILYLVVQYKALLNSIRVVMNEGIVAIANWGWLLPLQDVTGNDASMAIGLLLVLMSFIFSTRLVWSVLFVGILLPFILQQPFHLISFSLLFISCLTAITYEKRQSLPVGHLLLIAMISCLFFPIKYIHGFQQAGHYIEQTKNQLQYGAKPDTELTNGDLQHVSSFERTNTQAFTIAMEQPRPMYLKSYVGVDYLNGWTTNESDFLQDAAILNYLQDAQHFQQTQFAQATAANTQTVSIKSLGLNKAVALTPYELAAAPKDFHEVLNIWQTTNLFGTTSYSYPVSANSYTDYPAIASELYSTFDTPYLKLEALHNTLSYRHYIKLPQEIRTLLQNHFEMSKHQSYEQTISNVQEHLKAITYNEQVKQPTTDFIQFLLEESKEGYSVHYATLATLLFRAYGVPARYVEGYIVTNEDISERKEMKITSNSRHAWTEIYIDWIGWMPVEVTPGYADKMPPLDKTSFEQKDSTSISTNTSAPSITQVANPPLEDKPTPEAKESINKSLLWLLAFLFVPLFAWLLIALKRNSLQYQFMKLIRLSNKKWASTLPVHQVIYQINSPEALEMYQLYNVMMYEHSPLTKEQKRRFNQLLKTVKKQLN